MNGGQESVDLALLNGMHHITGAGHLSESRQGCLKGTRRDVLWQIESWLGDETDQRVFWLNGLAGTGKSTIAQTFAKTSFADGKLGASFFCSRDSEDRGNIHNIFPTLAFQLAYRYPEFRKELLPVLRVDPEIGQDSLCSQLEKVIIGPFKATRIQTLIIIDALDECRDEEPASAILSVLSRYTDQIPWVKFFITGRPEPRIRTGFRLKLLRPITEVLKLHDVERSSVDADIKLFLKTRLAEITKTRSDCNFTESWPSSYDIDVLCKKSAGLFIYASTVVKFVAAPYDLPTERLTLIISLPQSTTHEGRTGIDLLYTQVLEQAFHDADDAQELYTRFKLVLGAVLLVFYPLSTKTLSELLEKCDTPSHISNALRSLHSLLLVPNGEDDTVRPFHKSFPDFLTNPRRCKDERFFIDPPVHHIDILFSCLGLMKERLRKNICDLDGCPLLSDVKDLPDRRTAHIGSALEYSCRFWTKHLSETRGSGPHIERVKAAIDEFFTTHLLFWIEVLSITGHLNHGIYALNDIDRWYLSVSCVEHLSKYLLTYSQTGDSCEWTNDSQRLILSSFDSIRDSPTYVYRHVLPFCPSSSWLHKRYTSETLREVKVIKGHPERWETTTRVVSFRHHPNILVHRKDMIAVGLGSGDITILDAITGSTRSVLSAQNVQSVMSLALSMDGTLLVSGHFGDAIKLWDIQTGGVLKTFHGRAHSISISPDAILIASGSTRDIRLWDVRTGGCRHTIDIAPAPDGVTCLEFLPTVPGRLVSVSNGLVQQWDTNSNKAGFTASGHHVDFSSDGKHFVLCDEGPPTVRDTISGTTIATLRSPGQAFSRCSFSPSDEFVAGVAGLTVYVWNVTGTPRLIETFTPDTSGISSLAYSFSLISMHIDGKIRLRRIDNNSPDSAAMDTTSSGSPQANIVQTTLQEGSTAISVDSIGTIHLWDLSTGLSEILLQIPEIENVGSARMVGDTLIIVHRDRFFGSFWEVSTWDAKAKRRLQRKRLSGDLSILDPTPDSDLGISKDGATFFAVNPYVIRTWSTLTGESTGSSSHRRHTHTSTPLSIDLDGPMIWIRSLGQSQAWGCDLRNLKKITLELPDIPKRLRLACLQAGGEAWGNTSYSRIIDVTSQTEVFRLPGRFAQPGKVVWDGRYLFAVYETGELLILDFSHMTLR